MYQSFELWSSWVCHFGIWFQTFGDFAIYSTLCKSKNVPYTFVQSKQALCRTCGISKPDLSACMTQNEGYQIKTQFITIQQEIKKLLEYWNFNRGPSKLDAQISSKQFFGLKFCFE